jgi:hypothetical protein
MAFNLLEVNRYQQWVTVRAKQKRDGYAVAPSLFAYLAHVDIDPGKRPAFF